MKKNLISTLGILPWLTMNALAGGETVKVISPPAPVVPHALVESPSCPKAFQGFYLGANIGYGIGGASNKVTGTNTITTPIPAGLLTHSDQYGVKNNPLVKGVDGGLSIGYTHRFDKLVVGLDFTANWVDSKSSGRKENTVTATSAGVAVGKSATFTSYNARLENSLQLAAKLGWVIDRSLPFIKLGWDNSCWKLSSQFVGQGTNFRLSNTKRLNAFLWGAGVDFLAVKNVTFGFEYTGSIAGRREIIKDERATTSWKPQYNKFAITTKYIFN
ncbi:MAG: outer membrane beta-barrel protein [Alphaproteobacteria bacterium]|jgi:opacity protein-like surface antigen|nr:outer membrane beta-barrel protein [Alphaproteobacteria bacterium]MBP7729138.1 outer membrane beta-barrel protein [Alphaproteobacteria bacterium]